MSRSFRFLFLSSFLCIVSLSSFSSENILTNDLTISPQQLILQNKKQNISPSEFIQLTQKSKRLLIVGAGLVYSDTYPVNALLFDINPKTLPDVVGDISSKDFALYQDFKDNPFDVIILEYLDIPVTVQETTLTNIKSILKKGGELISNVHSNIKHKSCFSSSFFKNRHLTEVLPGIYFDYEIETATFPFLAYADSNVNLSKNSLFQKIDKLCFHKLEKPFFLKNGFHKIKIKKNLYKDMGCLNDKYVLSMKKK
jgi:hypothetical protein